MLGYISCTTLPLHMEDPIFSSNAFAVLKINGTTIHHVSCSVRGDLGLACNAAGMIDRFVLGIDHLYQKPVYRNLKECNMSKGGKLSESVLWEICGEIILIDRLIGPVLREDSNSEQINLKILSVFQAVKSFPFESWY